MSTDSIPENLRPTRASAALAVVVTLGTVAVLLRQAGGILLPAAVGGVGVSCLAVGLWLLSLDNRGAPAVIAAGVLAAPVAAGVLVGTVGAGLSLVGASFPAPTTRAVSARSLAVVAQVGLVGGCLVAILGVCLGARNVADSDVLRTHYWVTLGTGSVPALIGGGLSLAAFLAASDGNDPIGPAVGALLGWLSTPGGGQTHLASLLGLAGLAVFAVRTALGALPVAELLADRGSGTVSEARVDRARAELGRAAAVVLPASAVAFVIELAFSPSTLRETVSPPLYDLLVASTTTGVLRVPWLAVLALVVPAIAVSAVIRRIAQASVRGVTLRLAPAVAGILLTVGAVIVARPVVDSLVGWVRTKLPGPLETAFSDLATSIVGFYGPVTVVVVLVAVLVGLTALFVLLVRFLLAAGYLTQDTVGYSLAGGGLFFAAAFAGASGVGAWVVFGGLVAALFVWDVGRFGTVLGQEIGQRTTTRAVEVVHAGGTLAVGLLAAVGALGLAGLLAGGPISPSTPSHVALIGVFVGLLFLVEALR